MEPQVNPSMYAKKEFLVIKNTYKDQSGNIVTMLPIHNYDKRCFYNSHFNILAININVE